MVTQRRLAITVLIALAVDVLFANELALRLGAGAVLLLSVVGFAVWSAQRREWTRHDRPAAAPDQQPAELVTARVGEPAHAVARFVLQTQHGPDERWHGEEHLWIAVSDTWIWLFHQTPGGDIGGVKSRFSRTGMHSRWTEHQPWPYHLGELSWPADPWFIAGELRAPRGQRLRLIGLLAGDELGVRHLVTRTDSPSDSRENVDHENER